MAGNIFRRTPSTSSTKSSRSSSDSDDTKAPRNDGTKVSKTIMEMMSTISPVTPYLSVSGCLPVSTKALLSDDYTAAVCCTNGFEYDFPKDRIDYMHIRIDDCRDTDLRPYFGPVCQMIETHRLRRRAPGAHGRVLVFCAQGVSRSVSFVLAYLMVYGKMSLVEAYDLVRQRRRLACPNVGFFKQLIDLERQVFNGQQSVRMIEPIEGFEVADVVWKYGDDMLKAFRDL